MQFRVRALGQIAAGTSTCWMTWFRLEVTLPWLLHKFAEAVQAAISTRGRVLLEKKVTTLWPLLSRQARCWTGALSASPPSGVRYFRTMEIASRPFGVLTTRIATRWPSAISRTPARSTTEMCRNTSLPRHPRPRNRSPCHR